MKKQIISKEQFLNDVAHEVEMLKIHATKEQIDRLDLETFDPKDERFCIYGQMTGNCRNKEAKKLMDVACIRVVDRKWEREVNFSEATFREIAPEINGKYKKQMWKKNIDSPFSYLSMIETYILLKTSKPKNIIKYLKGETNKLVL